jgi:hypothetical protein
MARSDQEAVYQINEQILRGMSHYEVISRVYEDSRLQLQTRPRQSEPNNQKSRCLLRHHGYRVKD